MKNISFIKIISSLPVILLALYFSRVLGVILILVRLSAHGEKKRDLTPIVLVIAGLVVLIPKGLDMLFDLIKFNTKNIPYFNDIVTSAVYTGDFMKYSKALIIIGIIFGIITYFLNKATKSVKELFKTGFDNYTDKQIAYERENDLKIKEKQARAKTTQVVVCKKCGASNVITEKIGKCKYCRNTIVGE